MDSFGRRTLNPRSLLQHLADVLAHAPQLWKTMRSGRIERAFAEKIMLAVTQANGCRYCARFHSRLALREGVPPSQIQRILAGELGEFPEGEAVALAFAQHWAETAGQPDPEVERRYHDYYGPQVSADILNWMRMINFGNLAGNTIDAILWRLGIRRSGG